MHIDHRRRWPLHKVSRSNRIVWVHHLHWRSIFKVFLLIQQSLVLTDSIAIRDLSLSFLYLFFKHLLEVSACLRRRHLNLIDDFAEWRLFRSNYTFILVLFRPLKFPCKAFFFTLVSFLLVKCPLINLLLSVSSFLKMIVKSLLVHTKVVLFKWPLTVINVLLDAHDTLLGVRLWLWLWLWLRHMEKL